MKPGPSLNSCHLPMVLEYLLSLLFEGLSVSSVKVHLAASSAYSEGAEGSFLFAYKLSQRFFKGPLNVFPHTPHTVSQSALSLVLAQLKKQHFEPLASCPPALLSRKVVFLVHRPGE